MSGSKWQHVWIAPPLFSHKILTQCYAASQPVCNVQCELLWVSWTTLLPTVISIIWNIACTKCMYFVVFTLDFLCVHFFVVIGHWPHDQYDYYVKNRHKTQVFPCSWKALCYKHGGHYLKFSFQKNLVTNLCLSVLT